MRRTLIAGNWKMNGSLAGTRDLIQGILNGLDDKTSCDVLVCPTFVHVGAASALLAESRVMLGAQDVSEHVSGAFTGEVAAPMLADAGCSHVLVGHSERRTLHGESDAQVAAKFIAAQAAGLVPVLCIGETLEEREQGRTEAVVAAQVDAVIEAAGVEALARGVVAYEPVWAIGTGLTATPEQAQAVHAFIRGRVAAKSATIADSLQILYGGSMKPGNAGDLLSMQDIDGGLIGGAALNADDFLAICQAAGE